MEDIRVKRLVKALGLERHIVGIEFLAYRQEFEESKAEALKEKRTFCGFVNKASRGESLKVTGENFSCLGGAQSIGVLVEPETTKSGRLYEHCGLYSSHAVARSVNEGMQHIKHKVYGVKASPLEETEDADVVIILGNAKQMMRIIQGYSYEYGVAHHLTTVGNQAMCSDLCAKPFMNNDINFSLMCCGARASTQCTDGEMGVGMPIQIFRRVVDGVLATLNLTETNNVKKEILERLDSPDELGFEITMNTSYGKNAGEYREKALKMEKEEAIGKLNEK